jgi:hypothetical protein
MNKFVTYKYMYPTKHCIHTIYEVARTIVAEMVWYLNLHWWSTWRKPPTCPKSLTNLYSIIGYSINYTSPWLEIKLTTFGVLTLRTDFIARCKLIHCHKTFKYEFRTHTLQLSNKNTVFIVYDFLLDVSWEFVILLPIQNSRWQPESIMWFDWLCYLKFNMLWIIQRWYFQKFKMTIVAIKKRKFLKK